MTYSYDRRKQAGFNPEQAKLVKDFQKAAQQQVRRWKLPTGFKEVSARNVLKGVNFEVTREDGAWRDFWAEYQFFDSKPHIELRDSEHHTVKLPLETPSAKVLSKLWAMQKKALRSER